MQFRLGTAGSSQGKGSIDLSWVYFLYKLQKIYQSLKPGLNVTANQNIKFGCARVGLISG
jgi:hypothetical protein